MIHPMGLRGPHQGPFDVASFTPCNCAISGRRFGGAGQGRSGWNRLRRALGIDRMWSIIHAVSSLSVGMWMQSRICADVRCVMGEVGSW